MSDFASSNPSSSGSRWRSAVADTGVNHTPCGYCKSSSRSSVAHGLIAYSLTVQDYQELIDRGWRRSGTFLYKPDWTRTCCPQYTIRLKASSFTASREQVRVMKRMTRFLEEDRRPVERDPKCSIESPYDPCGEVDKDHAPLSSAEAVDEEDTTKAPTGGHEQSMRSAVMEDLSHVLAMAVDDYLGPGVISVNPENMVRQVSSLQRAKLKDVAANVEYTSSIAFSVCAQLKGKQKLTSAREKDQVRTSAASPVQVAEHLAEQVQGASHLHGLSVQACKGHINFMVGNVCSSSAGAGAVSKVRNKLLRTPDVSCNRPAKSADASLKLPEKHKLEITMARSTFDAEEFELYTKYQRVVHNDKPEHLREASYCRFLVETPLIAEPPAEHGSSPSCGFGSFHQQYRIDGRLIAVGVVDILPNCLSSKYLFWDPDFSFLSLGKFTALQEIQWVQQAVKSCPSLEYYYMGYYIHSCPKMQYKAAYKPSELLCPVQLSWVPYTIAQPLIEKRPVACLSAGDVDFDWSKGSSVGVLDDYLLGNKSQYEVESSGFAEFLNKVPILFKETFIQLKDMKHILHGRVFERLCQQLRQYVDLVGHNAATRMVYAV